MEPIQRVFEELAAHGCDVSFAEALEVFGRKGDWQTQYYSNLVSSLEVWEIDPELQEELKYNLPKAKIKITDSYEEIKTANSKYDIIVIDNPQSVFGENDKHCEHFDLFPDVFLIARDKCLIILNVNFEPYDLHDGLVWWERRKKFYKTDFPQKLSAGFIVKHYNNLCKANRFHTDWAFFTKRNTHISYLSMALNRT